MDEKKIDFLTQFVVESDAIERIYADPELVRSQLRERYCAGHVGAILLLETAVQKRRPLSQKLICQVQGLITAEQHTKRGGETLSPEWIGTYRRINVAIGGRVAPPKSSVPARMRSWFSGVTVWQKRYSRYTSAINLKKIAVFHYDYERIHPFADGNGRSGRALVYYLMQYCGLNSFIFTASDRHETYYRCFKDPADMIRYFKTRVGD